MRLLKIFWMSVVDFFRDDGLILAGSISYFTMMAFVPFCLFMVAIFGHFLGQYPEFHKFFLNKLAYIFPSVTKEITNEMMNVISYKGLGKFSLLLYGLLSYQVFASVEHGLNKVFKVREKRNLFSSFLVSLLMVTLITLIFIISFGAASLVPLLLTLKPYLPGLTLGRASVVILRFVLPFVLVFFTVCAIYVLVPKAKVRISNALKGAVFTSVMLEIAKHVYTWYVVTVMPLGKIYGSLAALIVFLLWMFYSSSIFLVGAEIVHKLGNKKRPEVKNA